METVLYSRMEGEQKRIYTASAAALKERLLAGELETCLLYTSSSDLVWALSDMFNQLMVLPNVIGLVGCTALVVSLTKFKK